MSEEQVAPIPIVLGVTGHRDLHPDSFEKVTLEINRFLDALRTKYPNSPLLLLSPHAPGADRMTEDLVTARGIAVLPATDTANPDPGIFVARHCQILIALWDGVDLATSDTARVIRWQKEGHRTPAELGVGSLDRVECGPVYHIRTPRAGGAWFDVTAAYVYPKDGNAAQFEAILKALDDYNGSIRTPDPDKLRTSRDWLMPSAEWDRLPDDVRRIAQFYASADETALRYQRLLQRMSRLMFAAVALAVVSIELYAHVVENRWQLLAAYAFLLGVAGVLHRHCRKAEYQQRHLDYRALAEALRVQVFWSLAGLSDGVADHYLRQFRSQLDWIRQAVRSCRLTAGPAAERKDEAARFGQIATRWVADQQRYFANTAPKKRRIHERIDRAARQCFLLAILSALALLGLHLWTGHMTHWLVAVVFLFVVVAAMLKEWDDQAAHRVDAQRYEFMESLFTIAKERLENFQSQSGFDSARDLLKELGREALSENADWVIQHRHREVAPPSGS